jgi:Fe-S cluster biogenesis protein NfuA
MARMLIHTEQTPNPATRKFLPGQTVMEAGSRDFPDAQSAEASPLASALFATGMVEGVFFGSDFISVTVAPTVEWPVAEPEIIGILLDHFVTGAPLFRPGSAGGITVADDADFDEDPADADIIAQIRELIETRVRPAVAQDGGDIVYRGYKDGRLFLAMQGACSGCPSSTATLKNGIEQLLKHYVPEVTEVRAI